MHKLKHQLSSMVPAEARQLIRDNELPRPTSGVSTGFVQANLAILPVEAANHFDEISQRNNQALPLIERLPTGHYTPRISAPGSDLRTDVGSYMVFDGDSWSELPNLLEVWRKDFVAFIIGCSFSAERALIEAGVDLRHIELGTGVPIYKTNRALAPAGQLEGHLVVSMRSIPNDQVRVAELTTARYPLAHGAPILVGPGQEIGCRDGRDPDWGGQLPPNGGETPMYWACGVTPQTIIEESGLQEAIVHSPGHMFITDIPDRQIRDVSVEDWRERNGF